MSLSKLALPLCVPLLAGLGGCVELGIGGLGSEPTGPVPLHQRVYELEGSLDPLRELFNAASDRVRVIVLLSPSCETCAYGAAAVRQTALEAYPDEELLVLVVWIDVGVDDDRPRAMACSQDLDDPRVRHFHDPKQMAGRAFAEGLLPTGMAWDTYLIYRAGAAWDDLPPRPTAWASQLGRIAGDNFHPREKLYLELRRGLADLLGEPAGSR